MSARSREIGREMLESERDAAAKDRGAQQGAAWHLAQWVVDDGNGFIRTARMAHSCAGWHDGTKRVRCDRLINKGERYVEYCGESSPFQSGLRYHFECAATQGLLSFDKADAQALFRSVFRVSPDGESDFLLTFQEVLSTNADDTEVCDWARAANCGDRRVFGGGAMPVFVMRRIA